MTVIVRIEVPKGVDYLVAVTTQSKRWNTELGGYEDIWDDDAAERTFLPGVNGWLTIHSTQRIAMIEERPLSNAEREALGMPRIPDSSEDMFKTKRGGAIESESKAKA